MSLVSRRVVDTAGATIQVTDTGDGEPALVFLHYWGGSSRTWRIVIDRLGDKSRCIALDQRGWGASIATDARYDLSVMADDVEAVARQLGLGRYVLVGHSMGGKVAQIVAARRPKELVGLVLIAPAPPTPMPVPETVRAGMLQSYAGLDAVRLPVTVVVGDRDQVEHEAALRDTFARFLPQTSFQVLLGIGHLSPLEAPDALADVCKNMLLSL